MLRICMVVHQYFHRDPRVRRYAEILAKKGMKVDVICPRYSDEKKNDKNIYNTLKKKL